MKFNDNTPLKLKTMTPVFIGDGGTLKPLSYVLEGKMIRVLDEEAFFNRLSETEKERYYKWLDPILTDIADTKQKIIAAGKDLELRTQLQRQRRELESKLSIKDFLTNVLRVPKDFAAECQAYAVSFRTAPERDGFRTHIKDTTNCPYIPGSELKGALRTALLHALMKTDEKNYATFEKQLKGYRNDLQSKLPLGEKIRRLRRMNDELEDKLIRGKDKKGNTDAKYDFLRFLQVSDSNSLSTSSLCVEMAQSQGTGRYTRQWLETMAEGTELTATIAFGDPTLILEKLNLQHLESWLSKDKILEACYLRSQDILEEEIKYFASDSEIKNLIEELQEHNQPHSPLLRLGQGQGFLGTTINLLVKHKDPELFDAAIREGVSLQRRWKTQKNHFPKTRRVIIENHKVPIGLLGWIKFIS